MQEAATKGVVEYDINEAYISTITDKYKDVELLPDDKNAYAMVMAGLKKHRDIRIAIDKKRKLNNEGANAYIKANNARAKELHNLNDPGESRLKDIRQVEDDRIAKIEAEQARIEKERVDSILGGIQEIKNYAIDVGFIAANILRERLDILAATIIDESIHMEFTSQAISVITETVEIIKGALVERERLDKEDVERKIEAERIEKLRKEQAAEQVRLDEARQKQEAEAQAESDRLKAFNDKIIAEQKKAQDEIDASRKALEAEKQAEMDRIYRGKMEEEARIQAEKDAIAKVEKEAQAKAEAEKKAKEEAERIEAMRPDKEKLIQFAGKLREIEGPILENDSLRKILSNAISGLLEIARIIETSLQK